MMGDEIGALRIGGNSDLVTGLLQPNAKSNQRAHIAFGANREYNDLHGLLIHQIMMPDIGTRHWTHSKAAIGQVTQCPMHFLRCNFRIAMCRC